jgi:acetylornithine deacetylase/succinyl-diaminopimelate desuccinylase-like protein
LNIGLIKGGTSINTIADLAELEIDLRSEDKATLDKIELAIRRCCNIKQMPEPIEIGIEQIGSRPGGVIDIDHPLVQAAIEATRKHCRVEPQLGIASTDASLPLSMDLPAICVGITLGGHAHSLEEFIEIGPIANGFAALREMIDVLMRNAGSVD